MQIHTSVRIFAVRHKINVTRDDLGFYSITHANGKPIHSLFSAGNTAQSGLAVCRKYLRFYRPN